jgi:hypothetical protein
MQNGGRVLVHTATVAQVMTNRLELFLSYATQRPGLEQVQDAERRLQSLVYSRLTRRSWLLPSTLQRTPVQHLGTTVLVHIFSCAPRINASEHVAA